jgi:hypothetical protein
MQKKNVKIKYTKTKVLLVALYGFETFFLALREKCELRMF